MKLFKFTGTKNGLRKRFVFYALNEVMAFNTLLNNGYTNILNEDTNDNN